MYAPRVFISMMGALLAFAVATYIMNGSLYTTFIDTMICAVIIQAGYFVCILILVAREKRQMRDTLSFAKERSKTMTDHVMPESIKDIPHVGAKLTDV